MIEKNIINLVTMRYWASWRESVRKNFGKQTEQTMEDTKSSFI